MTKLLLVVLQSYFAHQHTCVALQSVMLALVRVFIFLCSSVSMFTFSFIFLYFFCTTYTLKLFCLVISAYTFVICSLKINQSINHLFKFN